MTIGRNESETVHKARWYHFYLLPQHSGICTECGTLRSGVIALKRDDCLLRVSICFGQSVLWGLLVEVDT